MYSLPYLDSTVHRKFVVCAQSLPTGKHTCHYQAAGRRTRLLKHAGSFCVHVTEQGLDNHYTKLK